MANKDIIELEGEVSNVLPGGKFKVKLKNDIEIEGHLCGKMRQNNIILVVGDAVRIEMTPYDKTKGRIVYRLKSKS